MKTDHPDFEVRRINIHYGPGYWFTREPSVKEQAPMLAPGALVILSYSANNTRAYEWLRSQLANDRNGQISLDSVVFEDIDKGWHGTKYVMRSEKGWTGDPDKSHLNGGPQIKN